MRLAAERLWRDVRFGIRAHAKTPIATAAIVGTLSLGIGATAVSLSVARTFFMRPLPLEEPDRVLRIYQHQEGSDAQYFPISGDDVRAIREMPHVFDDVVAEQPRPFIIGHAGSYEITSRFRRRSLRST